MNNRFFITIIVVLAVIFGFFAYSKQKVKTNNVTGSSSAQPSNHIFSGSSSGVVLTEYGDYQCPACGQYYPVVKQIADKYKGIITFQFRNFPLLQIHPNAMAAHRAAEAASLQGKFWEMHDKLYETQNQWSSSKNVTPIFESFATELGLDITKFKHDVDSEAVNNVINADIKQGQDLGANSTPTFAINGKKIDNPTSAEAFSKLIDSEIAKKTTSQ